MVARHITRTGAAATAVLVFSAVCYGGDCPDRETMKAALAGINKQIEVVDVQPSIVPGLCETKARFKGQNRILYTDSQGRYLLSGDLYDLSDGTNLTRQKIAELNRFTPEEMARLESLTAFTMGDKGHVVYFVTDPQCPYCSKGEAVLALMAETGEIQVRVLLYPLQFHKGAREECISILCDNKGLEGLKSRYRSENQCEEGKRKVEETIDFLQQKGISGTPSYIFADGLYHSGVLQMDALRKRLNKATGEDSEKVK